jgi:hypothetical protein
MYNGSTWVPVTLSTSLVYNCSGAIVYAGAYNGPTVGIYNTTYTGSFSAGWTAAAFTTQNKHLCWAAADISGTQKWVDANAACAALTDDNSQWRLPNLKELQVLYEAVGGSGSSATNFSVLNNSAKGVSNSASAMQSSRY